MGCSMGEAGYPGSQTPSFALLDPHKVVPVDVLFSIPGIAGGILTVSLNACHIGE